MSPGEGGGAVALMGHGTEHFANAVYPALQTALRLAGREDVLVGTVEGWPGLEDGAGEGPDKLTVPRGAAQGVLDRRDGPAGLRDAGAEADGHETPVHLPSRTGTAWALSLRAIT